MNRPSAPASRRGVDVVAFSGDKLLGGPQAGIVAGRADLVAQVGRHPLMRALRADKLTHSVLDATLDLWSRAPARDQIPVYRMLTMTAAEIDRRALALADHLTTLGGFACRIIDGASTIGGGSAPGSQLATRLLAVEVEGTSAAALEAQLRAADPPIIARIQDGSVVLDLRTVDEAADVQIGIALAGIKRGSENR